MSNLALPEALHTVTFDCWSTLIHEAPRPDGRSARIVSLAQWVGVDEERTHAAFTAAWKLHAQAWHRRVVFAGPEILQHTLQLLGVPLSASERARLLTRLEDEVLEREVVAITGARELLGELRAAGIRTALICDTGFTPGRIVRQLLARAGLLRWLEVTIFSEEIGVPKPHERAFHSALSALGSRAAGALHVGDLRRSDVAGARAVGMATVRFRGHNDDCDTSAQASAGVIDCAAAGCDPVCAHPEADCVVDSYAALSELLRPGLATTRTTVG
jgi:putative hydrolase of the HAD superfamily